MGKSKCCLVIRLISEFSSVLFVGPLLSRRYRQILVSSKTVKSKDLKSGELWVRPIMLITIRAWLSGLHRRL